jgi:hypothetical protein
MSDKKTLKVTFKRAWAYSINGVNQPEAKDGDVRDLPVAMAEKLITRKVCELKK